VTHARITQIMKLLDLAPDIQEQILFLEPTSNLNERILRPVAAQLDWEEQRRLFQELTFQAARRRLPIVRKAKPSLMRSLPARHA
jgi:hypothetical protein